MVLTNTQLADWVEDARQRTFQLIEDLSDEQLMGPLSAIVNPLLWEVGHVAWFQEKWVLRHVFGQKPIRQDADLLYDSSAIPHDTRWDLPLPSRRETIAYMKAVRDGVLEFLNERDPTDESRYFMLLAIFHEDMHTEAFTYTRQTLAYPAPAVGVERRKSKHESRESGDRSPRIDGGSSKTDDLITDYRSPDADSSLVSRLSPSPEAGPLPGDVEIPGGTFWLGATRQEPFVFDNEKWAHPREVRPFAIARAPVTQAEFMAFVDEGGYRRRELWSEPGWRWRERVHAAHPVYWQRDAKGGWLRRDFDQWVPLEAHRPVIHVNWYEAEAYCQWADRRLLTELEWEVAAAAEPDSSDGVVSGTTRHSPLTTHLFARKRRFPWGDEPPMPQQANLDWRGMGCVDVAAWPAGDSYFGCRQMIGNVWEWTASTFLAYPGFVADPYKEYSEPWFGTHKVLRGGCWATRSRLLRNTWRNYYTSDRRDVWAGFRTARKE